MEAKKIIEKIKTDGIVDKMELISMLDEEVPEYETLKNQWLQKKLDSIIAQEKDSEGRRMIFTNRGLTSSQCINIDTCDNPEALMKLYMSLNKRILGLNKSLNKIVYQLNFKQVSMFDKKTKVN